MVLTLSIKFRPDGQYSNQSPIIISELGWKVKKKPDIPVFFCAAGSHRAEAFSLCFDKWKAVSLSETALQRSLASQPSP